MNGKEQIKKYLDAMAKKDKLFAKTYAKENKNIDDCFKYICAEVAKMREHGEKCLMFSDEEVYGMAIHYYDEDDIVIEKAESSVSDVAHKPDSKKKTTRKKAAKKVLDEVEFPLF